VELPRLGEFLGSAKTYDPTGKFSNAFLNTHAGSSMSD
jgi:hypothetical protein